MPGLSPQSIAVDLSRLPAPQVLQPLDFEAIRSARLQDLQTRLEGFDALVESDPAVKLQETDAYRELLTRAAINDAARSVMLAFAIGSDLDHLGAFYGAQRLVIRAATLEEPELLESDADFRTRIQLAPEELPYAGLTGGAYRSIALRTAPSVKDVATIKGEGGRVDVVLLGRDGDGAVAPEIVTQVSRAFQDDEATQLTDIVTVRAATIVPYSVQLVLSVRPGPDQALVKAAAEAGLRAYAALRHRVGQTVFAQMLEAAASVGGVEQARVGISIGGGPSAWADVVPGPSAAAWLQALVTTVELV